MVIVLSKCLPTVHLHYHQQLLIFLSLSVGLVVLGCAEGAGVFSNVLF